MTPGAPGTSGRVEPAKVGGPPAVALPDVRPPVPAAARACLDCGAPLTGKFCAACGQKDEPLRRGLKDLALEFFQHPLVDTKLWRSLVPLLFRPGALTEEYLAGRRTRYVRPLKLYLTVSVTFFALLAVLKPEGALEVKMSENGSAKVEQAIANAPEPRQPSKIPWVRWFEERFKAKTEAMQGPQAEVTARALNTKLTGLLPKMIFVFLPIAAVLFKLFWWKRYFVEHLVFSLHLHAFTFTAGMLLYPGWKPVTGVFLVWSTIYSLLAFKRVYRDGWVKTLAKLTGLTFVYTVLLSVVFLVTAFGALLFT
jgi:hypothetical protein